MKYINSALFLADKSRLGFWEMGAQRLGSISLVPYCNFRFRFCGHPRPVSNQKIWILWVFLVFWLPCCLIKDWNDQKWKPYIYSKQRGGLVFGFYITDSSLSLSYKWINWSFKANFVDDLKFGEFFPSIICCNFDV